ARGIATSHSRPSTIAASAPRGQRRQGVAKYLANVIIDASSSSRLRRCHQGEPETSKSALSRSPSQSDVALKCVASFRRAVWNSHVQHDPFVATSCAVTLGDWLSGRTKPKCPRPAAAALAFPSAPAFNDKD